MDFDKMFSDPKDSKINEIMDEIRQRTEPMFMDQTKYFADKKAHIYEMGICCCATMSYYFDHVLSQQPFDIKLIQILATLEAITQELMRRKVDNALETTPPSEPFNPESN